MHVVNSAGRREELLDEEGWGGRVGLLYKLDVVYGRALLANANTSRNCLVYCRSYGHSDSTLSA